MASGSPAPRWTDHDVRNKTRGFPDECNRVEAERRFSLANRKCGLGLIMTKLQETSAHSVAMSILVLNLRKIQCALYQVVTVSTLLMWSRGKPTFVQ